MAYLSYNGSQNNGGGNGLIIALAMMMLIFAGMNIFMPKQEPPANQNSANAQQEQSDQAAKPENVLPIEVKYQTETQSLETGQLSLVMTNVGGGGIQSVKVKDPDRYAHHGEFIRSQNPNYKPKKDDEEVEDHSWELLTVERGGLLPLDVTFPAIGALSETQYESLGQDPEHKVARFRFKDPNNLYQLDKTFTVTDTPYVIHAKFDLSNFSQNTVTDDLSVAFYIKQIKEEEPGLFTPGSFVAAKCYTDGDMEYYNATDKDKNKKYTKDIKWFGVDESYFAMAMSADYARECEIRNDVVKVAQPEGVKEESVMKSIVRMPVTLDAQKSISYEFDIYLGPKESRYLQDFGEERHLDAMIDYGWMEVLAKPMAWILDKFHDLTGNWGIAIIMLTIIVRMLLWPVAQKSSTSMMRMSKLAPLMQELQEKYKDDPQTLMQKQAELYKKFNINPFGCLPLLLQMPIFFALYRCIFVTGGLYHAEFFGWIHDLSAKDPYFVLPLISVGLIVFQQLITPTATKNKQQKYMMMFMPVMIGAMMLWLPAGLCLYMVISSMIGMVQSLYTRKILVAEEWDLPNAVTEGLGSNAGRVIEVERTESKDKRVRKRRQRVKDRGTKDGDQAEDGDEADGDEK